MVLYLNMSENSCTFCQVTGIAMLALAIYLRMDPSTNHLVTTSHTQEVRMYHLICYILIGVGAVMTFIGFLGCCSAFQESRCMLGAVSPTVSSLLDSSCT